MADLMQLVASLEWITLGLLVFWKLRRLNKKLEVALDDLQDSIKMMDN